MCFVLTIRWHQKGGTIFLWLPGGRNNFDNTLHQPRRGTCSHGARSIRRSTHPSPMSRVWAERLRTIWSRDVCPTHVEERQVAGAGAGLFALEPFAAGDIVFSEKPVCGTAALYWDEPLASEHCAHCAWPLSTGSVVRCPRGCNVCFCSHECAEEAEWVHHAVLCRDVPGGELWIAYEAHCQECANEYYLIAARIFASLRHLDTTAGQLPWNGYAGPVWWECMKRPVYSDSSGTESSDESETGSSSLDLDAYFADRVKDQTAETLEMLRKVFQRQGLFVPGSTLSRLLTLENFARTLGILRTNALAIGGLVNEEWDGFRDPSEISKRPLRGMALYRLQSLMNHRCSPNCRMVAEGVASTCDVQATRDVNEGEELCIDYLAGSSYSLQDRRIILLDQYHVDCTCDVCTGCVDCQT